MPAAVAALASLTATLAAHFPTTAVLFRIGHGSPRHSLTGLLMAPRNIALDRGARQRQGFRPENGGQLGVSAEAETSAARGA